MDAFQWQNVADNVTNLSARLVGILQVQSLPLVPVEVRTWLEFTANDRRLLATDAERLIRRLEFTANMSELDVRIRDEVCRFAESAMRSAAAMVDDAKFYDSSCVENAMVECAVLFDHGKHVLQLAKTRAVPRIDTSTWPIMSPGQLVTLTGIGGRTAQPPTNDQPGYLEIIMDESGHTITRVGSDIPPIPLSALQLDLCKLFVARGSDGVTRGELDRLPGEPNARNEAISNLRSSVLSALALTITDGRGGKSRVLVDDERKQELTLTSADN